MTIRTRVYETELENTVSGDDFRLLVMVEDWGDGSQTVAFKCPDTEHPVWSPKLSPVRDEQDVESA